MKRLSPRAIDGATSRTLLVVDDPDVVVAKARGRGGIGGLPVAEQHGWRLGRIVDIEERARRRPVPSLKCSDGEGATLGCGTSVRSKPCPAARCMEPSASSRPSHVRPMDS